MQRLGFSRRSFHRMCAGVLFGRRLLPAAGSAPLTWAAQPAVAPGAERRYRADALVIVFSVPLLHRKGVGDGSAVWSDSAAEDGSAVRLLAFTGRSNPQRAAGLNRFGFIQELSRTVAGTGAESLYFGVMTSSPEETVAEARKALHANAGEAPYSAIEGRIAEGSIETAGTRFIARTPASPAEQSELIERARQALAGAPRKKTEFQSAEAAPRPFLHALATLLNEPNSRETRYAYNGRFYRLRVERSRDSKVAAQFQEAHLIPGAAAVTRITGSLCREDGGKPIDFRLWIEEGAPRPIPLRIEYQPKSYLRLTFEALA